MESIENVFKVLDGHLNHKKYNSLINLIKKISLISNIPKKAKYFFLIVSLSYITGLYPVTTDTYLAVVFLISIFYFHFNGLKYDISIFYIIIFLVLISFTSTFFYGSIQIMTLVGMIFRLLIPYYIIKILDQDFIIMFERTIYFFAILSIPFYLIQLIKPDIYLHFNPLFHSMMTDLRYQLKIYNYVLHTIHFETLSRNSGFTWEPGVFGYVIGIAIMFNVVRNNFTITKRSIVLLLIGLTTLSTTFYIFVLIFFAFYLYERKTNLAVMYIMLPLIVVCFVLIFQLPFMNQKIESQVEMQSRSVYYLQSLKSPSAGRFGGLILEYIRFIEYPFGYGINNGGVGKDIHGDLISGPSGLARYAKNWGIFGIVFLLYSLYKLSSKLSYFYRNKNKIFVMITVLLFLFSNPIEREPIFLMLIYLPLYILTPQNIMINFYKLMVIKNKLISEKGVKFYCPKDIKANSELV